MNTEFANRDVAQLYADRMAFKVWHRLVFFAASLAIGFWFLVPLHFPDELPLWVILVPLDRSWSGWLFLSQDTTNAFLYNLCQYDLRQLQQIIKQQWIGLQIT